MALGQGSFQRNQDCPEWGLRTSFAAITVCAPRWGVFGYLRIRG